MLAPVEVPANIASSFASRLAIAFASAVETMIAKGNCNTGKGSSRASTGAFDDCSADMTRRSGISGVLPVRSIILVYMLSQPSDQRMSTIISMPMRFQDMQ